jgi:hypothetical protein
MNYNNDFRYDLEVGKVGEKLLNDILHLKKIEVKRDSWIYKSGNIAIEYESRGKPSGISNSHSEWWAIVFSGGYKDDIILLIESECLKKICRKYYINGSIKDMGDSNTSKSVLIPINKLFDEAKEVQSV